ncbi:MAG: NAD(P)H-dependent oxidoreductase [Patescibacteria group bacterium]|nr:NAD(P)H-dependent oxidoreductase [Patescibacteria group bacterium]
MKYFIPIILGTGRKGAKSEKVAEFVYQEAIDYGFDSFLIKPRDWLDSPFTEEMNGKKREELVQIICKADGFIIITPEYNHSFPGELKILIDNFYEEYKNKPICICGVSSGLIGGARAVEHLRLVAIELSMVPIRNSVYFSEINENTDLERYKEFLLSAFSELNFYCQKLR